MKTTYQLITLGSDKDLIKDVLDGFYQRIAEMGISKSSITILDNKNFKKLYKANAPSFCLYFGYENSNFQDLDLIKILLTDATLILPIVSKFENFNEQIPEILRSINGFELSSTLDIEKLVSSILEGLSLLRLSRRIFISYKRDESSLVAIQLFESLEKAGFDVFLDTHSIRPGEPFQDELWHRMADTDVVVLLNTPGFLNSNWTTQELAKANSMSIGILQLIWPEHKLERDAELSLPFQLKKSDFGNNLYNNSQSYLSASICENIIALTESLRARSLASRQDNIVSEFISSADKIGQKVTLQSEKFITLKNSKNEEIVVIPTVGVPQAFTYNQSEELVSRIKTKEIKNAYILYDHRNIREKWINHLSWLDNYLPIKTIKIVQAEKWLRKI
jgi:hypothetical protein